MKREIDREEAIGIIEKAFGSFQCKITNKNHGEYVEIELRKPDGERISSIDISKEQLLDAARLAQFIRYYRQKLRNSGNDLQPWEFPDIEAEDGKT